MQVYQLHKITSTVQIIKHGCKILAISKKKIQGRSQGPLLFCLFVFFPIVFMSLNIQVNQKWIMDPTQIGILLTPKKKNLNTLSCSAVMWRGVHESPFLLDTVIIIECKNMVLTTSFTLLTSHFGYILTYQGESSRRSLLRLTHRRLNRSSHLHGC